jgi:ABC-2 type transport system permease protein
VALMVVSVALAAAALGACIVAFSRTEQQAGIASAAIAMLFGILGGSFFNMAAFPSWLQPLSKLTLNRWALDGFTDLTQRGLSTAAVLPEAGVLLGAALLFGAIAVLRLPRRFVR